MTQAASSPRARRARLARGLAVAAALAGIACAGTRPENPEDPDARDARITETIESRFEEADLLEKHQIHVRTESAVVTLHGIAASEEARERAAEVAREVEGVEHVVNELLVRPEGEVPRLRKDPLP